MAKQNSIAKKIADFENGNVNFEFADGSTFNAALTELNEDIINRLALHGLSQKLGDSYAGAGGEDDPVEYAKEALAGVYESLKEGNWTQRTGGTAGPRVTLLAEALHRATGRDLEECSSMVNDLRVAAGDGDEDAKAKLDAIKNHPQVKAAQSEIRAERAAAKAAKDAESSADAPDLGSLLG